MGFFIIFSNRTIFAWQNLHPGTGADTKTADAEGADAEPEGPEEQEPRPPRPRSSSMGPVTWVAGARPELNGQKYMGFTGCFFPVLWDRFHLGCVVLSKK